MLSRGSRRGRLKLGSLLIVFNISRRNFRKRILFIHVMLCDVASRRAAGVSCEKHERPRSFVQGNQSPLGTPCMACRGSRAGWRSGALANLGGRAAARRHLRRRGRPYTRVSALRGHHEAGQTTHHRGETKHARRGVPRAKVQLLNCLHARRRARYAVGSHSVPHDPRASL